MSIETELHPLEIKVLCHYASDVVFDSDVVARELNLKQGQANQALSWLYTKEYIIERERGNSFHYELTELGTRYAESGTPEERLIALLQQGKKIKMGDVATQLDISAREAGSAFGALRNKGIVGMDDEKYIVLYEKEGEAGAQNGAQVPHGASASSIAVVRALLQAAHTRGILNHDELNHEEQEYIGTISKKRGAGAVPFRIVEKINVRYTLSEAGIKIQKILQQQGITGEEIGMVTPAMLERGDWRDARFRPYNINVPPMRVLLGRANSYGNYLHWVKDKLVSLGFEEFDGPLIETEFWNCDALYMPQFHSARDVHDVYMIENPTHAKKIDEPYLANVARTHEDGWNTGSTGWQYKFDKEFTRRLILRSQGTALSAKTLPHAKIPGKYFGILRCFRYDKVDATHLSDFYQTEGIVLGDDVNLCTLLGMLETFAKEIAMAEEVQYVPGYFPFTEPSIEVHIKHPTLGWFELGGSGIFRPEVTKPLGIEVPVLAWGLGIDRMALMHLKLNDLRELFSHDLEKIRLQKNRI